MKSLPAPLAGKLGGGGWEQRKTEKTWTSESRVSESRDRTREHDHVIRHVRANEK